MFDKTLLFVYTCIIEVTIMLKRHKKILNDYFFDLTLWFWGIVILIITFVAIFAALLIFEGPGDVSDMIKPFATLLVFLYALYSGRKILKYKSDCKKDLKKGNINTKKITVEQFGVYTGHNLAFFRRKLTGRIKYGFVDSDGEIYHLVRGKKKLIPDDAIEGATVLVTYLENTHLVIEISFDIRDDIDARFDNFKRVFPHYFERIYD